MEKPTSSMALKEYLLAVEKVCIDFDYELSPDWLDGDDHETTRRFIARSREKPIVEVRFGIFADDAEDPLKFQLYGTLPLKVGLFKTGESPQECQERDKHAQRQDTFVHALKQAVHEKRKTWAQGEPPMPQVQVKRRAPLSGKEAWEQYEEDVENDVENEKLARAEERLQRRLRLEAAYAAIGKTASDKSPTKNTGGRPRIPDDAWAWQEVNEKGRSKLQVYKEWLGRIGDRANILADSRDSFNKAVKKRRPGKK